MRFLSENYYGYFEKYKKYYDSLKDQQSIVNSSNSLSSDCSNSIQTIKSTYFNKIRDCKWKENGKNVIVSNIIIDFEIKLDNLKSFIETNLVTACNLSINDLFPILTNIRGLDMLLYDINEELKLLKNELFLIKKYVKVYDYEIINGERRPSGSRYEINNDWVSINTIIESKKEEKVTKLKEIQELCASADEKILSIRSLNYVLSSQKVENINFLTAHPEVKDLFTYYTPILQEKLGINDEQEVIKMLIDTYNDPNVISRYGTFNELLRAIVENCPDNYLDYDFNPVAFEPFSYNLYMNDNTSEYELAPNYMEKYMANYEEFDIDGCKVKIVQTFPRDETNNYKIISSTTSITKLEQTFYDIYKANCLNVLSNKIPSNVMKSITKDGDLKILIPYNKDSTNYNADIWGGYYTKGTIVTYPFGTIHHNNYYGDSVIPHEIGHNFDDAQDNPYFIIRLKELIYGREDGAYTSNSPFNSLFSNLAQKYAVEIDSIEGSGYTPDDFKIDTAEFYACSFEAYINKPDELKTLCPEVYDAIDQMIGGTW